MTKIEWTHRHGTKGETWNPIVGCSIKSPGCKVCYAMNEAYRKGFNPKTPQYHGLVELKNGHPVWNGRLRFVEHKLLDPLQWRKPRTVFVNSMGDLFHEDCPDEWIDRVFAIMMLCPQHTFQVLTKRADRMRDYVSAASPATCRWMDRAREMGLTKASPSAFNNVPLPNVWLGVSTERQEEADERIPHLLKTPAAIRFISAEPLIGPINLLHVPHEYGFGSVLEPHEIHGGTGQAVEWVPALDQVIVGGESGGYRARPMHPDWARSLRDQCHAAEVAFFFKQWGDYQPFELGCSEALLGELRINERVVPFVQLDHYAMARVGKAKAGRLLDGVEHSEWPDAPAVRSAA